MFFEKKLGLICKIVYESLLSPRMAEVFFLSAYTSAAVNTGVQTPYGFRVSFLSGSLVFGGGRLILSACGAWCADCCSSVCGGLKCAGYGRIVRFEYGFNILSPEMRKIARKYFVGTNKELSLQILIFHFVRP